MYAIRSYYEPEPEPIVITFSEEEMEKAKADSYEKGKSDGINEANQQIEKQATDTIALIERNNFV